MLKLLIVVIIELHIVVVIGVTVLLLILVLHQLITVLWVRFSLKHNIRVSEHILAVNNFKFGDQLEYFGPVVLLLAYWISPYLNMF